ncbi:MAG: hypothetical protein KKE11_03150 [Gammaproteobacteria bacterium]|nr:hypothetical protein [Gammaproteobacteria bacterium]
MLMFNFHLAFSTALIALALGAAILIWSKAYNGIDAFLAKLIGYIIIIASALNIACSTYYAVKYWQDGYFNQPHPMMMQRPMMLGQMMGGQMMKNKEMQIQPQMKQSKQMPNSMMKNKINKENKSE